MAWQKKTITIRRNPFHSPVEMAGDICLMICDIPSNQEVVLFLNPNIQHYEEEALHPGEMHRQEIGVSIPKDGQTTLRFHVNHPGPVHFEHEDKEYRMLLKDSALERLNGSGDADPSGQPFPRYDFDVEWRSVSERKGSELTANVPRL